MQNSFEFDKSPNSTESTWSPENNYEHQKGMKNPRNTGKLEGDNTLWQVMVSLFVLAQWWTGTLLPSPCASWVRSQPLYDPELNKQSRKQASGVKRAFTQAHWIALPLINH